MTARSTVATSLRRVAAPAPVPINLSTAVGAVITIKGLHIHPDTGIDFVVGLNTTTVLAVTTVVIVPSAVDVLGTLTVTFTLATKAANDTYRMYLLGKGGRKSFVGTVTIT